MVDCENELDFGAVCTALFEVDCQTLGLRDSCSVVDFRNGLWGCVKAVPWLIVRNGLLGCVIAVPWLISKMDFGAV